MAEHSNSAKKRHNFGRLWIVGLVAIAVTVILVVWGVVSRIHAEAALERETNEMAIPSVRAGKPEPGPAAEELVLPGNVQAYYQTPVYARTNGYLKQWYADIGTPVKAGQLLAEIDTPEVDDQLHQAQADLATAQANSQLAQITAKRWISLLKTDSVSKQETDEKIGDARAKAATVRSNAANVSRLRQLEDYKRVLAPFTGVVTARETDIGSLINANGSGRELFRVADVTKLRIYVQVPQTYTAAIKPGMAVALSFAEHPGKVFPATLTRTSEALDPAARTLLVELQVENSKGELLSGGFTEVHMKLPSPNQTVRVPVSALLFRADGLHVATITQDQKADLHRVTMGRDFGTQVEILTGLDANDQIIVNPPDSLIDNEKIRVTEKGANKGASPGSSQSNQSDEHKS